MSVMLHNPINSWDSSFAVSTVMCWRHYGSREKVWNITIEFLSLFFGQTPPSPCSWLGTCATWVCLGMFTWSHHKACWFFRLGYKSAHPLPSPQHNPLNSIPLSSESRKWPAIDPSSSSSLAVMSVNHQRSKINSVHFTLMYIFYSCNLLQYSSGPARSRWAPCLSGRESRTLQTTPAAWWRGWELESRSGHKQLQRPRTSLKWCRWGHTGNVSSPHLYVITPYSSQVNHSLCPTQSLLNHQW